MKDQNTCVHDFEEISVCVDGFDGNGNRVGFEHKETRCKKCGYKRPLNLDGLMSIPKDISESCKSFYYGGNIAEANTPDKTGAVALINRIVRQIVRRVHIFFLVIALLFGAAALSGVVLVFIDMLMGLLFILVYGPISCLFWWLYIRRKKRSP